MGKTNGSAAYKMGYCRSAFEMIVEYRNSPEVSDEMFANMAASIARNALEVIGPIQAESEGGNGDIVDQLKAQCVGHPHSRIPWPHRVLHDAISEIERLRKENADLQYEIEDLHIEAAGESI